MKLRLLSLNWKSLLSPFATVNSAVPYGKIMSKKKKHPVSFTNTHDDVTDLVNHGMVKSTKTWICWERNITFLRNKKILNLYLRWHILRSYYFVAEVTFKEKKAKKSCLEIKSLSSGFDDFQLISEIYPRKCF